MLPAKANGRLSIGNKHRNRNFRCSGQVTARPSLRSKSQVQRRTILQPRCFWFALFKLDYFPRLTIQNIADSIQRREADGFNMAELEVGHICTRNAHFAGEFAYRNALGVHNLIDAEHNRHR